MKRGDIVQSLIYKNTIVIVTGINNSSAKEQFRGVYLTGINKGWFFENFDIEDFEVVDIEVYAINNQQSPKWIFPKGSVVYVLDENGWHVGRMQNQVGPEITLSQPVPHDIQSSFESIKKEISFDLNKVFGITIENPFKGMPKEEQPKVYYNNCRECDEYLSTLPPGGQLKCWHQPWKK